MYILGIWDGHDAGAALIRDNEIIFASNEERYTNRKLEIEFPFNSIKAALAYANIKPKDIDVVAFPTIDFTKTVSRIFPYQKEKYYKLRRRKLSNKGIEGIMLKTRGFQYRLKYITNTIGILPLCKTISTVAVKRALKHLGFEKVRIVVVNHHVAHASTAAFASNFNRALIVTLDGYGDGLSGTVSILENKELKKEIEIKARDSIGILYEQVTNLVGMRELEDEGKVMAMADYSYPFDFENNKLKDFIKVDGTKIIARYNPVRQYGILSDIAWATPREQMAYYAQQLLEVNLTKFFKNIIERYKINDIAMSGGLFSNVKANRKIRLLDEVNNWFVFPHMGDGGIAMGSAMYANYLINGITSYKFDNIYFGDEFSNEEIAKTIKAYDNIEFNEISDKAKAASDIILNDQYLFWFQGRMEYGPRALGNRSILAPAYSDNARDLLNLYVKQREWYQPFAPSILKEDAERIIEDMKGYDKFMTMAYKIKDELKNEMKSVIHVDNTIRPQMVGDENPSYRDLLKEIKKKRGYGIVLNTSFNIHGMPIVRTPKEAIETMKKTKTKFMIIGDYLVENKGI